MIKIDYEKEDAMLKNLITDLAPYPDLSSRLENVIKKHISKLQACEEYAVDKLKTMQNDDCADEVLEAMDNMKIQAYKELNASEKELLVEAIKRDKNKLACYESAKNNLLESYAALKKL
ncbi:MAG: hypothetical protein IKZ97_03745 [Butyrivibrio sp.]|nr:hypothetical protein [Butyrivibrio sp.]